MIGCENIKYFLLGFGDGWRQVGFFEYLMTVLLFWLVLLYLSVPHHLIQLLGLGASIKPFDFIACCMIFPLMLCRFRFDPVYSILGIFSLWYLIRSMWAVSEVGISSLLYGVKFLEYFVVCLAVRQLPKRYLEKLLSSLVVVSLLYLVMELSGIRFTVTWWGGRLSGQFGGPYELGGVSLLLACMSINDRHKVFGIFGVALSVAKASIIGYAGFLMLRINNVKWIAVMMVFGLVAALYAGERLYELGDAFGYVLSSENIREVYNAIPTSSSYSEYQRYWLDRKTFSSDLPVDLSTGLRVYSYVLALKSIKGIGFLVGNGPGFYSVALDSSVLRVFVETGLVGILLFSFFLVRLSDAVPIRGLALAIGLNVAFVDVFFSGRFIVVLMILYQLSLCRLSEDRRMNRPGF